MRVYTNYDPRINMIEVYVEVGRDSEKRLYMDIEGRVVEVKIGMEVPWHIRIDAEVANALGIKHANSPSEPATDRHLADAIETRNRILTMVERLIDAR